jgi:carbonic anhydrase
MSVVDDALKANRAYARDFGSGDLPARPAKGLIVVTCMDARMTPEAFLDLDLGDAHIIRNAGAVVTDDVLRSLTLSTHLMETRTVFVVGHTQCAIDGKSEEGLREATHAGEVTFHAFADLDEHIQTQVRRVETSKLLPDGISVHGFIYQVEDGRLRQVV